MNVTKTWTNRKNLLEILKNANTKLNYGYGIGKAKIMTHQSAEKYLGRIKKDGLIYTTKEKHLNKTRYHLTDKGKEVLNLLIKLEYFRNKEELICKILDNMYYER